jgi:hypothetical protein
MPLPVKLQDVIAEMDIASHTFKAFINRKTGDLTTLTETMIEEAESGLDFEEEDDETVPSPKEVLESDDYLELPDKDDIHEWSIMERFSGSVEKDAWREELLTAIHGRGAFRIFRDSIHRLGIEENWHAFRNEALSEIARDFLLAHDIPFIEGSEGKSGSSL